MEARQRYALITELNQDWAREVAHRRDGTPWPQAPELSGCGDLAEVLAAIRHRPDPVLGALLGACADGDLLAGRTVLQAMLGKVVRLSRSHPDLGVEEFVAALWCRIRNYPLTRRPNSIAANLALDTRKDVLRAARLARLERPAGALDVSTWERLLRRRDHDCFADGDEAPDLHARRLIELAETSGVLDAATSSALRLVYLEGVDGRAAAARLGTSVGMIRYRCSRGIRELTRHAAVLQEAA